MSPNPHCGICHVRHRPNCTAAPKGTRWPLAPLAPLAAAVGGEARLADRWDWSQIIRARDEGLTDVMADRWATRCRLHPEQVWPGWCDAALTPHDRQFVAEGWRPAWLHNQKAVA